MSVADDPEMAMKSGPPFPSSIAVAAILAAGLSQRLIDVSETALYKRRKGFATQSTVGNGKCASRKTLGYLCIFGVSADVHLLPS